MNKKRRKDWRKKKGRERGRKRKKNFLVILHQVDETLELPDETNNASVDINNTTHHNNTTIAELKGKKGK